MTENSEPRNIQLIRQFLEQWFRNVTRATYTERFIYHDGTQTSELALDREFINAFHPEKLQEYMEYTVLPTLRASPGQIIRAGADGISVRTKQLH
jgi:hypothetical protein